MKFATVGDNCIDYYDQTQEFYPGGNPLNVSVNLRRLGAEASYLGVVGNDKFGEYLQHRLQEKRVDITHLRVASGCTALTHVVLQDGERIFGDYEEGVLTDYKLTAEDIDFLCSHDLVITGLWGMVEKDLWQICARGVPVAFDFAVKYDHPIVDIAVPYTKYAFFSCDNDDMVLVRGFMKQVQARGPQLVVVTRGKKGSIAYDGERFVEQGVLSCRVVDTMGAGDSYIAGFLHSLLQNEPLEQCMAAGATSSAVTLGHMGAW